MSNEEFQSNEMMEWCTARCCGPSNSGNDMQRFMNQCSNMMEICRTEWESQSTEEPAFESQATPLWILHGGN